LRAVPGVTDAVVIAAASETGDTRLIAYYTGAVVEAETLRSTLTRTLPDYMVPAAYVPVAAWPLTPNGKLARAALPAPDSTAYASSGYEAPAGPIELAFADVWREVLGVEQVGRHDDFFVLGGHSLLAVRVSERLQRRGLTLDVRVLFETPELAAAAASITLGVQPVEVPPNLIPTGTTVITASMLTLFKRP
jgi:aryl carrier-like protein